MLTASEAASDEAKTMEVPDYLLSDRIR